MVGVRRLVRHSPGFGRLLSVRLTSQITDGIFQAALVGGILFNPERHADPLAVAGGLAVLLLPYSLIGPFAGALLDHWDRRNVLLYANVLRAAIIGLVAISVASGAPDVVVLISALAATGAKPISAGGGAAGLPHVARRDDYRRDERAVHHPRRGDADRRTRHHPRAAGDLRRRQLRQRAHDDRGDRARAVSGALAHGFPPLQLGPDEPTIPDGRRSMRSRSGCGTAPARSPNRRRSPRRCRPSARTGSCSA